MQTKFTKSQFTVIFLASKYNTCRQTKPVYPPPPQTKSIEGSEFGQQYNYLFQSENNELKPKYKLNNVYKIHVIVATYIFETPFFISNNYFHYKISFVYLGQLKVVHVTRSLLNIVFRQLDPRLTMNQTYSYSIFKSLIPIFVYFSYS